MLYIFIFDRSIFACINILCKPLFINVYYFSKLTYSCYFCKYLNYGLLKYLFCP